MEKRKIQKIILNITKQLAEIQHMLLYDKTESRELESYESEIESSDEEPPPKRRKYTRTRSRSKVVQDSSSEEVNIWDESDEDYSPVQAAEFKPGDVLQYKYDKSTCHYGVVVFDDLLLPSMQPSKTPKVVWLYHYDELDMDTDELPKSVQKQTKSYFVSDHVVTDDCVPELCTRKLPVNESYAYLHEANQLMQTASISRLNPMASLLDIIDMDCLDQFGTDHNRDRSDEVFEMITTGSIASLSKMKSKESGRCGACNLERTLSYVVHVKDQEEATFQVGSFCAERIRLLSSLYKCSQHGTNLLWRCHLTLVAGQLYDCKTLL